MKSDLNIAQESELKPIEEIAALVGVSKDALINYGPYIAKIDASKITKTNQQAKLILITAMSPTPAGEGKTTTTIGLADALNSLGKKAVICVREPSLGPVFGMKGGATGGGYSQVLPMENINLHFTGDFHAVTSANNLLSALIDNHVYHGNALGIDVNRISFKRCMDMNDRSIRNISVQNTRYEYQTGFDISVASEVMAIFCLATSLHDLEKRLGEIEVAKNKDSTKEPILAKDLKAQGPMVALLKDAFMPNLTQSIAHTPTFIHGGPFANIAHGCNSFAATDLAMQLGDYVVTEAGFGADLGAEKFINIKCRQTGLNPDLIVIVATIRALKYHGGIEVKDLNELNMSALEEGFTNLQRHIKNSNEHYAKNVVVAINYFASDTDEEIAYVQKAVNNLGFDAVVCRHWAEGPKGAAELATKVLLLTEGKKSSPIKFMYKDEDSIQEKIKAIATNIYHAKEVVYEDLAQEQLNDLATKYMKFPVCIAKTPYSFSSDPTLKGAASDHALIVKEIKLARGAEFLVIICGSVMTMPGLPMKPASENMSVNDKGQIEGLS